LSECKRNGRRETVLFVVPVSRFDSINHNTPSRFTQTTSHYPLKHLQYPQSSASNHSLSFLSSLSLFPLFLFQTAVMATTATTPNPPGRHTTLLIGNNQRKHSVRTGNRSLDPQGTRPNAPVFLEEPLFLQGLSHGTATAGGSRSTATGSRASLQQLGMDVLRDGVQGGSTQNSKKRTAGEVLDLTNTTTNSPEQENTIVGPSGRQVKKMKMPWDDSTVGGDRMANKQKQQKKAQRAERQEKLAQESAMWRAKYKKAFPSFTFYFDTIDEATKAQLGIQVKKLGAVRRKHLSSTPPP